MKLSIVPPAPVPVSETVRVRRKSDARPAAMLQCPRCGSRQLVETRIGAMLDQGRVRRGTKQYGCSPCAMRGVWIVIA